MSVTNIYRLAASPNNNAPKRIIIMDIPESKLSAPEEFPFPFTPYSIQKDLMRNLYEALEGKKLGIFESPTGTGKSMSLICGSLKWLLDAEKRIKNDVVAKIEELQKELKNESLGGANWLDEFAIQAKTKQARDRLQNFLNCVIRMENRIVDIGVRFKRLDSSNLSKLEDRHHYKNKKIDNAENRIKNNKIISNIKESVGVDDCELMLDDFGFLNDNMVSEEKSSDSENETKVEEKYNGIKIFFCSRTHSQLSQIVKEIQKSPYKDMNVRVVTLASRQNYCINDSVLNLKHLPMINEKCQDLNSKKGAKVTKKSEYGNSLKKQKTSEGCPFYQHSHIEDVKIKILKEIQDVEHLVGWGKALKGCPYYASRHAIDDAQIIVLPYSTILHKNTREACGILLKNSIVIIDEAHNLLDAIGNIYSTVVSGYELSSSQSQLTQYKDKYSEKLSPSTLLYLNQLIFIVSRLYKKVSGKDDANSKATSGNEVQVAVETLAEFVLSCEIDTINLYKVSEFVAKSNIINKVRGFIEKYAPAVNIHQQEGKGVSAFLKTLTSKKEEKFEIGEIVGKENASGSPLLSVVSFIRSLTNHCSDGRIVSNRKKTAGTSFLKFLLLNPASHFGDIVREARSVILAGGTMQPISEFTDQLFSLAGGSAERIATFSCGHIIPPDNILPIILSTGPSGKTLDFSYQQRNKVEVLDELGRILVNVCSVVPAGVVCFFPSYEYENLVFQHLEKTNIIEKLRKRKKIVREPRKSNKIEEILKDYEIAVKKLGALLFSVVGGKLSEGLNFNDDLGRCVIIVGLPYPNFTSPELKEKMNYLESAVGPGAGKIYYENLCMKAVNQSIGRSVRHKSDYASVLLIDERYARAKCTKALPGWIRTTLRNEPKFGAVIGILAKFFASKKGKT